MAADEGYWGVLEVYEGLPEENEAEGREYLTMVERFATGGRMLDIGCGYGYFLKVAQRSGWDVAGFDVSPRAVQVAGASVGADRVQVAVAGTAVYEPERFDVITMWNVIEHMGTPRASVQRIVEWLKPGGYLIVETPNAESLIRAGSSLLYRLTAGRLGLVPMLYEATEGGHIQIFSTRALERLLTPMGMSTVASERLNSPVPTLVAKNSVGDPRLLRTGKRLALQLTNGLATVSGRENRIRMVFRREAGPSH